VALLKAIWWDLCLASLLMHLFCHNSLLYKNMLNVVIKYHVVALESCLICRYNCNRYDEEEARRALDAQEVNIFLLCLCDFKKFIPLVWKT